MYGVAAALLLYLIVGKNAVAKVNTVGSALLFCFLFARTLRGTLHFLWQGRGRLTFARVVNCVALRAPAGLRGQSAVYMSFADFFLLPLCIAVSAFRHVKTLAHITFILRSHCVVLVWLAWVFLLGGVLLNILHWCVILPMGRSDPHRFMHGIGIVPRILAFLATWMGIPTLSVLSVMLPCDGEAMSFVVDARCLSSFHRWCIVIGGLVFLLYFFSQDVALGVLEHCGDTDSDDRRCDGLMLQFMMFHRCAYVFIAVFADKPAWYVLAGTLSTFLLLLMSRTFFASARLLNDLTCVSLLQCLVGSLCCSLTYVMDPSSAAWLWMCFSLLSGGLLVALLFHRNGMHLFESDSEVWILGI
ncbi:hypothetical protein TraAM80_04345 [Trypanosoma rangeli]|uniref:Uncharacterized protein n=1 Tax=Trypanosoma rangeli TaxID=5698 RepID=A0A422NJZ6_TRYRA|nr:uncharacterized protein TraAM80_04345 [Trypanosoma rangeli]RNF05812.1 hypothetical protein TraAM80_04345 [Trypanosoma rangeli]|eukprot:RNF05812.1 hypothetical protein TraAM80_04345 [Trypanosoma rangeli]